MREGIWARSEATNEFQTSLMCKLRPNELSIESLLLESMRLDIRRLGNDGVCNVLRAMETPNERIQGYRTRCLGHLEAIWRDLRADLGAACCHGDAKWSLLESQNNSLRRYAAM